jgi:glycine hydroxymethyltransferase
MGKDYENPGPDGKKKLSETIQRAVFPFFQGTPNLSVIAAKARALAMVATPDFRTLAKRIVTDARVLAKCFADKGYRVLTGGSNNHIVLIDVLASGVTGVIAERALEECNIIVNKNRISGDKKTALVTSGMRLGTNSLALRGMSESEMPQCADLIHQVLSSVKVLGESDYELDKTVIESVLANVKQLCSCFPIPRYPVESWERHWLIGEESGTCQVPL